MEAGLAIVALAIVLDRLSQAAAHATAERQRSQRARLLAAPSEPDAGARRSSPSTTLLSLFIPAFAKVPDGHHLHHGAGLEGGRRLGHRQLLRRHRSLPRRRCSSMCSTRCAPSARASRGLARCSCSALPATSSAAGGWPLVVALLTAFCAVTGLWEKTMATRLSVRRVRLRRRRCSASRSACSRRAATAFERHRHTRSSTRCRRCPPSASSFRS